MNINDRYERRGMQRQMDLERKDSVRGIITRRRYIEADIDWTSLNVESRSLIDPATGRFFFIPGVSVVGGGDVVRP